MNTSPLIPAALRPRQEKDSETRPQNVSAEKRKKSSPSLRHLVSHSARALPHLLALGIRFRDDVKSSASDFPSSCSRHGESTHSLLLERRGERSPPVNSSLQNLRPTVSHCAVGGKKTRKCGGSWEIESWGENKQTSVDPFIRLFINFIHSLTL